MTDHSVSGVAAPVVQAKVIRKDGTVEYHYSVPEPVDEADRERIERALALLKQEET